MKIFASLVTMILLTMPLASQAAGGYTCSLDGSIHGASIGFVISGQVLGGDGRLTCRNENNGRIDERDVRLHLVGGGVGFDFTVVKSVRIHAVSIETGRGIDDVRGSFNVGAIAGAQILTDGVSVDTSLKLSRDGLGFDLGLIGEDAVGLGVRLQGMVFSVEVM